jgi:DNA repair exonuclease SbcCD ATPase subunit
MSNIESESPLVITRLEVESFKRIRVARITPHGSLVMLAGQNKQGKTSILDAIEALLVGKKATPAYPIHQGSMSARVKAYLGNAANPKQFVISRKYATGKDGPTQTLEILNAQGDPVTKKQQGTLDELFEGIAFEVTRFLRLKPDEQDKLLKDACNLDFTHEDSLIKANYEERTKKNAKLSEVQARIVACERDLTAPAKEETSAALIAELEVANERDRLRRESELEITDLQAGAERETERIEQLRHEIAALEQSIRLREVKIGERRAWLEVSPSLDKEEIKERLAKLEQTNARVRANAELDKLEDEERSLEQHTEQITAEIESLKESKAAKLAAAKFPVKGLGFDEHGPTLNGFPLQDASQRERIELCVALACELAPQLLVFLVRDAAVIDEQGLRDLAEFAQQRGAQVWLETIAETPTAGVVFVEDGAILDPPVAVGQ